MKTKVITPSTCYQQHLYNQMDVFTLKSEDFFNSQISLKPFPSKVRMLFTRLQLLSFYSQLMHVHSPGVHVIILHVQRPLKSIMTIQYKQQETLPELCHTVHTSDFIKQRCSINTGADCVQLIGLGNDIHYPIASSTDCKLALSTVCKLLQTTLIHL